MEQHEEDKDVGVRLIIGDKGERTIVSRGDVADVLTLSLTLDADGYVRCNRGRYRYLHNYILKHRDPDHPVDHINCCTWDNRRSNLRILTRAENTLRPRRLDEEETRLLEDYQNGLILPEQLHEWLQKRRDSGKL